MLFFNSNFLNNLVFFYDKLFNFDKFGVKYVCLRKKKFKLLKFFFELKNSLYIFFFLMILFKLLIIMSNY